MNHPTSQCFTLKKVIQECIDKGIVRPRATPNASANKVSIALEEARSEDDLWDFICSKGVPSAPRSTLKRRNGKSRKKKLLREKEERLRELIPYRPRWIRWPSWYQPFTIDDYLQSERLRPFYKRIKVSTLKACQPEKTLFEIKGWGQSPPPKQQPDPEEEPSWWTQVQTALSGVLSDDEIYDPFEVQTVACNHVSVGNGTNQPMTIAKARSLKRRERQRKRRKQGFTRFTGFESPVDHLLRYATECCGEKPDQLRKHFGRSLGPIPAKWYRTPAVQEVKSWTEQQDLSIAVQGGFSILRGAPSEVRSPTWF